MTAHDDLREAVARAILDSARSMKQSIPAWGDADGWKHPSCGLTIREAALTEADAALAVIRAHCLERVREIHSRVHMTDSDAFAEQVRQRALVAWQLAEDCNTSAAGAAGWE